MKEMKRIILALILVSWVAGAPMVLAQGAQPAATQGIFASFVSWLEILVEDLLHQNWSTGNGTNPGGEDPEFQAYIIPGG
jgi:hypothetical protein